MGVKQERKKFGITFYRRNGKLKFYNILLIEWHTKSLQHFNDRMANYCPEVDAKSKQKCQTKRDINQNAAR